MLVPRALITEIVRTTIKEMNVKMTKKRNHAAIEQGEWGLTQFSPEEQNGELKGLGTSLKDAIAREQDTDLWILVDAHTEKKLYDHVIRTKDLNTLAFDRGYAIIGRYDKNGILITHI